MGGSDTISKHKPGFLDNLCSFLLRKKKLPDEIPSDEVTYYDYKNRFDVAVARVAKTPHYRPYCDTRNPHGYYCNRPIIGQNTRIAGGIFLASEPAESLVVDEKYMLLRPLLSSFRSRLGSLKTFSIQREFSILEEIFELSEELLEWSPKKVAAFNVANSIGTDSKVALDLYLEQRIGVNRNKVLLAAYIIERLREDGHLAGFITIPAMLRTPTGGDEYLIYTFPNGVFATLDPSPAAESASKEESLDTKTQKQVA